MKMRLWELEYILTVTGLMEDQLTPEVIGGIDLRSDRARAFQAGWDCAMHHVSLALSRVTAR